MKKTFTFALNSVNSPYIGEEAQRVVKLTETLDEELKKERYPHRVVNNYFSKMMQIVHSNKVYNSIMFGGKIIEMIDNIEWEEIEKRRPWIEQIAKKGIDGVSKEMLSDTVYASLYLAQFYKVWKIHLPIARKIGIQSNHFVEEAREEHFAINRDMDGFNDYLQFIIAVGGVVEHCDWSKTVDPSYERFKDDFAYLLDKEVRALYDGDIDLDSI